MCKTAVDLTTKNEADDRHACSFSRAWEANYFIVGTVFLLVGFILRPYASNPNRNEYEQKSN